MKSLIGSFLTFCLISAIYAEQCYYYDEWDDRLKSITCYTGCCVDQCCDDYDYYWSAGSIAGAAVGSILAIIFIVAVITVVIRVCCGARSRGRIVYTSQVNPGVSVVNSSSSSMVNNVATPQMVYPQPPQVAPPPYSEVPKY